MNAFGKLLCFIVFALADRKLSNKFNCEYSNLLAPFKIFFYSYSNNLTYPLYYISKPFGMGWEGTNRQVG